MEEAFLTVIRDPCIQLGMFLNIIFQTCLAILGIPVSDVLRVLSSVLLLGNVTFVEGAGQELETEGNAGW